MRNRSWLVIGTWMFFFAIVSGQNASAATVVSLEASAAALAAKNSAVANDLERLRSEKADLDKKALEAKRAMELTGVLNKPKIGGNWYGFGGEAYSDDAIKAKAELTAAKQASEKAQEAADKVGGQIEKLQKQARELNYQVGEAKADATAANKALATIIQSQYLTTDFMTLNNQIGRTDRTLDAMAQFYDKSILGAYLKDKMGLLLNSNAMCDRVKNCGNAMAPKVKNSQIESEIFPKTSGSTRSQDSGSRAGSN